MCDTDDGNAVVEGRNKKYNFIINSTMYSETNLLWTYSFIGGVVVLKSREKESWLEHWHGYICHIEISCLTLRHLMSYIYGAPILDVSRSHTTTQDSR